MRKFSLWTAILLAGFLTGCGEDNTPGGAVQGYVTATGKGDIEKAMSFFITDPASSSEALRKSIEKQHEYGLYEAEIISAGLTPGPTADFGRVEAVFLFRGTRKRFGCTTKLDGKRWKISMCFPMI